MPEGVDASGQQRGSVGQRRPNDDPFRAGPVVAGSVGLAAEVGLGREVVPVTPARVPVERGLVDAEHKLSAVLGTWAAESPL